MTRGDGEQRGRATELTLTEAASATPPRARTFGGPKPGESVGRYRLVELRGAGGMGVVYRAHDPDLARDVALKLLHVDEDADEALQRRLLREAQAMARISHPNLVTVYDVGTAQGRVFIAMEFVDGWNLREWIEAEARPVADVVRVFIEAGRGLAAAHAAGVVHRDFKPDNVLVSRSGRVQVGDFGLARGIADEVEERAARTPAADVLATPLTRTGAVLGTPAYMAPEQHQGKPTDARTDQFSFAVALYEALYGQRPFEGETQAQLMAAVLGGQVRASRKDRGVPARVAAVIERALAVAPDARFPDMGACIDALARAARPRRRLPYLVPIGAAVAAAATAAVVMAGRTGEPAAPAVAEAEALARAARSGEAPPSGWLSELLAREAFEHLDPDTLDKLQLARQLLDLVPDDVRVGTPGRVAAPRPPSPPAPPRSAGALEVQQQRTMTLMRRLREEYAAELAACAAEGSAELVLALEVAADGSVSRVRIVSVSGDSTHGAKQCVVEVAESWRLPAAEVPVTVHVPVAVRR